MFKKKCSNCKKKIDRNFVYCPWCGINLKSSAKIREDYGMIGRDDDVEQQINNLQLPFGIGGIMSSLMKQLESEMKNIDIEESSMPKGFKVHISTGIPGMPIQNINRPKQPKKSSIDSFNEKVDEKEISRRKKLKQVFAKSTIRRLPEGLIYEIDAPGISDKKNIVVTKLEQSLEMRAYTDDKCYVKKLPANINIKGIAIKNGKIFLKLS